MTEEIRRYEASDAADVSAYIRENAGLEPAVEQYLALYRAVLDQRQPADRTAQEVDWHPARSANKRSPAE